MNGPRDRIEVKGGFGLTTLSAVKLDESTILCSVAVL